MSCHANKCIECTVSQCAYHCEDANYIRSVYICDPMVRNSLFIREYPPFPMQPSGCCAIETSFVPIFRPEHPVVSIST